MAVFRSLLCGAWCFGAVLAHQVGQEAATLNKTQASGHSTSTPGRPWQAVFGFRRQQESAEVKPAAREPSAGKPVVAKVTSTQLTRKTKEAQNKLATAEHQFQRAKDSVARSQKAYEKAQELEKQASDAKESASGEVQKAKAKRAVDFKRKRQGVKSASDAIRTDDAVISKAQHVFEILVGKWRRAKEEVSKTAVENKLALQTLKDMESALTRAQQNVTDVNKEKREFEAEARRTEKKMQNLKDRSARVQETKKALTSEMKKARAERIANKAASPKDIQRMKAHEARLAKSVHNTEKMAQEVTKELRSFKTITKA